MPGDPPTGPGPDAGRRPAGGRGRHPGRRQDLDGPDERLRGPLDEADPRYDPRCRPGASRRRGASATACRLSLALGMWLIAAPFAIDRTGPVVRWGDLVCGALVVVLAVAMLRGAPRSLGNVIALAGVWLSASVLWLDGPSAAGWNDLVAGAALLVLGLLSQPGRRLAAPRAEP